VEFLKIVFVMSNYDKACSFLIVSGEASLAPTVNLFFSVCFWWGIGIVVGELQFTPTINLFFTFGIVVGVLPLNT
jgi:hypothetical protein